LPVVKYGHPGLRQKGVPVEKITPEIKQLIADMFETMYATKGIGLAAQQVGRALQLTVLDVRGVTDRPSTLERNGKPADVEAFMPLVLLNPEIQPLNDPVLGPEGCLSFPELYGDVLRPESIAVRALDANGQPIEFRCSGLLARAVQHETDHLNGILFIDRMDRKSKQEIRAELDLLQAETKPNSNCNCARRSSTAASPLTPRHKSPPIASSRYPAQLTAWAATGNRSYHGSTAYKKPAGFETPAGVGKFAGGLIIEYFFPHQPEENRTQTRVDGHADRTGGAAGIIKPIAPQTDAEAIGLRLQLERRIGPGEFQRRASLHNIQQFTRSHDREQPGVGIEAPI
jgi:peptide deformylase